MYIHIYVCVLSTTVVFKPAYETQLSWVCEKNSDHHNASPIPPGDHCVGYKSRATNEQSSFASYGGLSELVQVTNYRAAHYLHYWPGVWRPPKKEKHLQDGILNDWMTGYFQTFPMVTVMWKFYTTIKFYMIVCIDSDIF